MDSRTAATLYYDAWREHAGDMSAVPLADDFAFTGPVANFDNAAGYRAMARQAGATITDFRVRHQFVSGDLVCSILDWEMAAVPGTLTSAEVLEIRDGVIVRGELIYDAEELRKAMAALTAPADGSGAGAPGGGDAVAPVVDLLRRSLDATTEMLALVGPGAVGRPTPCTDWTVAQVASHLIGSLLLLARVVEGDAIDGAEFNPAALATAGHGAGDLAGAMRTVAARTVAAFSQPGALARTFPYPPPGPTPGFVLANLCLLESLVHGWDVARGAGVAYRPDAEVIAAVAGFTGQAIGDDQRRAGLFGPVLDPGAGAVPLARLLGYLGRVG